MQAIPTESKCTLILKLFANLKWCEKICFDDTLFICFYSHFSCMMQLYMLFYCQMMRFQRFGVEIIQFLNVSNCAVKVDIRSVQGQKRAHDRFCTSCCTFVSYRLTFSLGYQGTYVDPSVSNPYENLSIEINRKQDFYVCHFQFRHYIQCVKFTASRILGIEPDSKHLDQHTIETL